MSLSCTAERKLTYCRKRENDSNVSNEEMKRGRKKKRRGEREDGRREKKKGRNDREEERKEGRKGVDDGGDRDRDTGRTVEEKSQCCHAREQG